MTIKQQVETANAEVMDMFLNARPIWKEIRPALEVVPGMKPNLILHPGPPIHPQNIPQPIKAGICGAAIHEGLAKTVDEAWNMVLCGEIELDAGQNHDCPSSACMVTSASMPVLVVEDRAFGGRGFSVPHPGMKPKVLRWGLYDEEVAQDLNWFRDEYCVLLGEAIRAGDGMDIVEILAKTAGMGDENHNRQFASSLYLIQQLLPYMLPLKHKHKNRIIAEFVENDRFFLGPVMAAVASIAATAKKIPLSSVMVGMGGNGVEFGIQIAGTANDWYTTTAPMILGSFLDPRTTKEDLLGYLGDSCVTEVYGLGGMSAIAGPSFVRMSGGGFDDARERTERARQVCLGEHRFAPIPWDDFRGFPVGLDIRRVVASGILPISHGGSALKIGGQGGAGSCELPLECFKNALRGIGAKAQEVSA